jgi:hypothetical protein
MTHDTRLAHPRQKRYSPSPVRIYRNSLIFASWLGVAGSALGCVGGPKEAADPHQILGEDADQGGVESTGETSPKPDARPAPNAQQKPAPEVVATRADCEAATRHVEELGIDLAINTETDPAKKKKMVDERAQTMSSPEMQQHIKSGTDQCLQRGTTRREARCIAQIQSEQDIDRCVR